ARAVLERRYLRRDDTGALAETPRQLYWRVATHVAQAELGFDGGTPARALAVAEEFYELMASGRFLPNSPTLTNAGRPDGMLSACFVLPVEDSVDGIFDSIKATALIQKAGGGTGFSFSRLRPRGDRVASSGGTTMGPLSFIQVFSKASESIQQGAFRKGANMGILRIDHPDVLDFVHAKDDLGQLTNYNISVAITNRFLDALRRDPKAAHEVRNPRSGQWEPMRRRGPDGKPSATAWTVGEVWDEIIRHAWATGEPGVVFIDRINDRNPIKNVGEIEATNPCGEQPLHPYDSCNLGSINVGALVKGEGRAADFDWDELRSIVHASTRFLDDVIEVNHYPLPQIDAMTKRTRRIGLGVMGFADALYKLGIPYDSEEGCAFGEELMRVLDEESHVASELLAEERGVFPAWQGSDWQRQGRRLRNSYTTTIAPTGSISILAGCSGGIEPMFSLAFVRQVMPDEKGQPTVLRELNYVFEQVARQRGFHDEGIVDHLLREGTLEGLAQVPEDVRRVFVTAHDITPYWHMRMQAAFQKHCDASISKTINFPRQATAEDVRAIYDLAVDLDVKGVTVYRDGCRDLQPMALEGSQRRRGEEAAAAPAPPPPPARIPDPQPVKLPEIMPSLRIRQMTPFGNMHVKVSVDPLSNREREVFAQLGKGGDVANSDLEAICRLLSLWLRSNGSLETALRQLEGIGSSLTVPTKEGRIMSLADGLATALHRYLAAKSEFGLEALLLGRVSPDAWHGASESGAHAAHQGAQSNGQRAKQYKLKCPGCASELAFSEGCVKCYGCGWSQC
ncbi:MAG TPA: adenosylcobalamin-dependent ribonucleoside-diphosphate reductase, partial [Planctomycetota bacterium]|nr:adenosylcobalamin-dependent ribonucleoside-diphosphate reductase [Planctomycetota bacterium]